LFLTADDADEDADEADTLCQKDPFVFIRAIVDPILPPWLRVGFWGLYGLLLEFPSFPDVLYLKDQPYGTRKKQYDPRNQQHTLFPHTLFNKNHYGDNACYNLE
jgi:hypothetical protein